jgi:predicted dehydrogenase
MLVEKPITSTLAEADELLAVAARHGVLVQVGHVERFNPVLSPVLPHVREPKYIDACRASTFKFRSTDIGVVFDLMIHDIDLVLSLARSPVKEVDALGVSVFGQFEDVANARLTFENGCVATLTASRASYQAVRQMQIWSERAFASLDFATRTARLVHPHDSLLRREFDAGNLSNAETEHLKDHLFEDLLRIEDTQGEPCDQLTAELVDFADSIRMGRAPRVSGEQGRNAVAVAERVLAKIADHLWDGNRGGRVGPLAQPMPAIIPGPHWHLPAAREARERKEAG